MPVTIKDVRHSDDRDGTLFMVDCMDASGAEFTVAMFQDNDENIYPPESGNSDISPLQVSDALSAFKSWAVSHL